MLSFLVLFNIFYMFYIVLFNIFYTFCILFYLMYHHNGGIKGWFSTIVLILGVFFWVKHYELACFLSWG